MGVYCFLGCIISIALDNSCPPFFIIFNFVCMTTVTALAIASIVLISKNLGFYGDIDFDLLKFVKDKHCSDGPLQYSLEMMYDALIHELMLNRLALGFIISAIIVQLIVALFFTDFKYIIIPWVHKEQDEMELRKVGKDDSTMIDEINIPRSKSISHLRKMAAAEKFQEALQNSNDGP